MAVINMLPNGFLVLTLSPREAVLLNDQILDPGDFPWEFSEAQRIAIEVKSQIKRTMEELQQREINTISHVASNVQRAKEEEQRVKQAEEQLRQQAEAEKQRRIAEEEWLRQQQKKNSE